MSDHVYEAAKQIALHCGRSEPDESDYRAVAKAALHDNEELRKAFPYCEQHKPSGGARAGCVICAQIELSAALSRIDYLCGESNEYEVSGYDVHCDPDAVVRAVESMRKNALRYRWLRDDNRLNGWISHGARRGFPEVIDDAIDIAMGKKS